MNNGSKTFFAPHLFLKNVRAAMEFYIKAFGAIELRRWVNDDGSVHVAEMSINGAMFHLHEEVKHKNELSAETVKAVTSSIGLFCEDPDKLFNAAIAAGGKALSDMQDFDYGYRQGVIVDPFGQYWLIQKKI